MSSADQPPPFQPERDRKPFNWRRPQFSMRALLGLLTLVAVLCTLGVAVPPLFALLTGLAIDTIQIGYTAILVVGTWACRDRRRLFFAASLTCWFFSLLFFHGVVVMEQYGLTGGLAFGIWRTVSELILGVAVDIALSLFGGWVALRAARFWEAGESPPSP